MDAFGCVRCGRMEDKGDDEDLLGRSTIEGATKLRALGYLSMTAAVTISRRYIVGCFFKESKDTSCEYMIISLRHK